jgi:ketosteroid isomerase-like protein
MRLSFPILAFACGLALQPLAALAMNPLQQQVADTERAFARTMAQRDLAGFASFVSEEAVFFSGQAPLHGKQAVTAWWKRYYEKPEAPFSWEPADIEVLDSGTLALSSGPVRDAQGKVVATFTSIWRLEAPGTWRIIFDKGNEVCDCAKK